MNIDALHEVLKKVYKEVQSKNETEPTQVERLHNAKTNIQPVNITIVNYVMVRAHAKREHELQSKRRGSMSVKEAKSNLVFVVEYLSSDKQQTVRAQRIILHPVAWGFLITSEELTFQA